MSTSVTTISSTLAAGTLGVLKGEKQGKTVSVPVPSGHTSSSCLTHFKINYTFASNGGGVNSFPLAINMALILAAMAAAISTPPGGAGFSPAGEAWGAVLLAEEERFPGRETEFSAFSLLLCCLTSTLCLGWAG